MAVCHVDFNKIGAEILAINVDSVLGHKVWVDVELSKMVDGGIPFPMISDPGGNIGRLYDVYDEQNGKTLRGTFIIGPDGYVYAAEVLTTSIGRSPSEILRQIKAFQNHLATGNAIPCAWKEGGKTIQISMDKAGKIWQEWTPNNC